MLSNQLKVILMSSFMALGLAHQADAQTTLGPRASGMAGAFVAVADDATAVYWNPAGLATGAYFSFVADLGKEEVLPGEGLVEAAERRSAGIVSFSAPPVGFAYYRQAVYSAGPREPVVEGAPGREEVLRSVRGLRTSTFAATLLQSVGQYVVIGASLKLVRGGAVAGTTSAADAGDALDAAAELTAATQTKGDVDAGVMVAVERIRLGLVARNLTTPTFEVEPAMDRSVELERQVRAGAAWGSGWPGNSRVIVAVDADLTARAAWDGGRRDVAAGVETGWKAGRLGVRAGVSRSTIGESRPVVAAGVSAGVTAGMFLEGHVARGSADDRSWSVGARFTF